jgi:hypothetical protein
MENGDCPLIIRMWKDFAAYGKNNSAFDHFYILLITKYLAISKGYNIAEIRHGIWKE